MVMFAPEAVEAASELPFTSKDRTLPVNGKAVRDVAVNALTESLTQELQVAVTVWVAGDTSAVPSVREMVVSPFTSVVVEVAEVNVPLFFVHVTPTPFRGVPVAFTTTTLKDWFKAVFSIPY